MLYSSPQAVLTGSTAMLARRELTVTGTCPLPAPPGRVPFQEIRRYRTPGHETDLRRHGYYEAGSQDPMTVR